MTIIIAGTTLYASGYRVGLSAGRTFVPIAKDHRGEVLANQDGLYALWSPKETVVLRRRYGEWFPATAGEHERLDSRIHRIMSQKRRATQTSDLNGSVEIPHRLEEFFNNEHVSTGNRS